jgi:hypothetical protein
MVYETLKEIYCHYDTGRNPSFVSSRKCIDSGMFINETKPMIHFFFLCPEFLGVFESSLFCSLYEDARVHLELS